MGAAKCLKVGPCRILAESELFTSRLILQHICFTLAGKALALGYTLGDPILEGVGLWIALATMFLPGLVLATFNICHYQLAIRDVLNHPSLLLLPTVTNYNFAAKRIIRFLPIITSSEYSPIENKGRKTSGLFPQVVLREPPFLAVFYILLIHILVEGKASFTL